MRECVPLYPAESSPRPSGRCEGTRRTVRAPLVIIPKDPIIVVVTIITPDRVVLGTIVNGGAWRASRLHGTSEAPGEIIVISITIGAGAIAR